MQGRLRRGIRSERGFSLIELLVVMLVIAILAAITLPAFLGQRTKAQDGTAKSALATTGLAALTYYTDNDNFSGMTVNALQKVEPSLKDDPANTGLTVDSASGEAYKVHLTHPASGHVFTLERGSGKDKRTCSPAGQGGCPADGEW
jgi:type IV pilus assembly protein PilA